MNPPSRILLVEDDSALRETLADVLTDLGYQVACACNGQEALDQLGRGLPPDLIVLDLVMPVMDGWAFREAQRRAPSLAAIPMLVLSASCPSDNPRVKSLGAQAVLPKPVGLERLVDALERILPAPPVAAAPAASLAH
ncbi:MAG TPA: response regulator [Anaeromyxobacter sp.]|nr:response regulator [Anaeromyxobacter sp.]